MCINMNPFPQVNYGQGGQAWNPSSRDSVYQQIERARGDAKFAQMFAADILFGKEGGGTYRMYLPQQESAGVASREHGDMQLYQNNLGGSLALQTVRAGKKLFGMRGDADYLYNENTLNAAKSWVPQAFGAPAVKGKDGNWYQAVVLRDSGWREEQVQVPAFKGAQGGWSPNFKGIGGSGLKVIPTPMRTETKLVQQKAADGYGFVAGNRITDANTLRLLNEGHHAFSAKGFDGSEVYVPWAAGFVPGKTGRGRPEAGNTKREVARGAVERDMITPGTAKPGNVIGGGTAGATTTLLSGAAAGMRDKTLLGGTK